MTVAAATETPGLVQLQETLQRQEWTIDLLQESIGVLEDQLRAEDAGWSRIGASGGQEFSREALRTITENSRLYAIKNPVIQRAVLLEAFYVWAQGVSIHVGDEAFNTVVQGFLDDEKNKAELGHQPRMEKGIEIQTDANLFFAFFANVSSGRLRVRTIPFCEIEDVIRNPQDRKEPWYYKRTWMEDQLDPRSGVVRQVSRTAYHPDWCYRPSRGEGWSTIGGSPVEWDVPIYHVKVGGFSDWKFGVSEVYAALDWAKAYKMFLEDVATIMRALSRFAAKLTTPGGKNGVATSKAKLGTTIGAGSLGTGETNPPPGTGSVFLAGQGANYEPYQLRGASISPEDGRRFLLMAAAATGWPEIFFGDSKVGNHATAKTLDRPTELRIKNRQTLWAEVLKNICGHAIFWAVKAPSGPLRSFGRVAEDGDGFEKVEWYIDPETEKPYNPTVNVDFPPVVEHDVTETVRAIVQSATLDGKPLAGTLDLRLTTRMLLVALGQDNVDEIVDALFPEGQQAAPAPPATSAPPPDPAYTESLRELRTAVKGLVDKYELLRAA